MTALAPASPQNPDIDYDLDEQLARGRADGSLIRTKAKMLLEHFGLPKLSDILNDPKSPASTILDASRFLMRLADMEPKANTSAPTGTQLNITFNIPTASQGPGQGNPLNITPGAAGPTTKMTLSLGASSPDPIIDQVCQADVDLPPKPEGFTMPDFVLTRDLIGPALPGAPQ